ncbi:hypothetical protein BGV40_17575 [Methanosarcina sp. Ant1]|nr:hypothetical protein BGV40_17575 [Methanosarcina sp. Ant1]
MGKNDSQVRNYILVGISAGVIAGCYFVTNLYGRDIRVIILLAIALLTFGLSTNNILKLFVIKESIEAKKQQKIEMNDERNTLIREKAGSKTNEYMLYLSTIIIFVLIFMDVEFWIICLVGFLTLVQGFLSIILYDYYSNRY